MLLPFCGRLARERKRNPFTRGSRVDSLGRGYRQPPHNMGSADTSPAILTTLH
jgi:hypothetical protein